MRKFLFSERSLVVVLFVAVLITFSLAHNDSKEIEQAYMTESNNGFVKPFYLTHNTAKESNMVIPAASVIKLKKKKK